MEDNNNSVNEEKPLERRQYTKQQNALYTVISVALFFVLYFGGTRLMAYLNRPYNIYLTAESVQPETLPQLYELCGLSEELTLVTAQLSKADGTSAAVLFSVPEGPEGSADSGEAELIRFEYGDPTEDVRVEFYPYADSPAVPEYAFGTQYVDIDRPERAVSLFEFEGKRYALYIEYENEHSSQLKAFFKDGEKVYQG